MIDSYRHTVTRRQFCVKSDSRKRCKDRHLVSVHKRGYDRRWRRAREGFLRKHPLCKHCEAKGRIKAATELDHIVPWRSVKTYQVQRALFWNNKNWQGLCSACHAKKTTEDRKRYTTYPVMTR